MRPFALPKNYAILNTLRKSNLGQRLPLWEIVAAILQSRLTQSLLQNEIC